MREREREKEEIHLRIPNIIKIKKIVIGTHT